MRPAAGQVVMLIVAKQADLGSSEGSLQVDCLGAAGWAAGWAAAWSLRLELKELWTPIWTGQNLSGSAPLPLSDRGQA